MKTRNKEWIKKSVMHTVSEHLGIPSFRMSLQTDIMDDLGANELDLRELVITVEERFGVEIPIKKLSHIRRIEDIVEAIREIS